MSAASLELEITESAMMLDPARALRVIQEIDRLGVLISIDDFGTGYSSLGYLRDLPVHSLKLDKSFVMGMRNNTDDRIIVESTAQMAHALKLELVAEGVESEWDAQFLAAAGYDYAQGFCYSRALPADQCLAWIVEFNATAMLTAGRHQRDDSAARARRTRRRRPRIPLRLRSAWFLKRGAPGQGAHHEQRAPGMPDDRVHRNFRCSKSTLAISRGPGKGRTGRTFTTKVLSFWRA